MTTFKDMLSKEQQGKLKELHPKSSPKSSAKQKVTTPQNPDDSTLFAQAMMGVKPLIQEKTIDRTLPKKDPTALFRRANAEGGQETPSTNLSDMQALLNPVSGDAYLSYKIPTLQNKVFEQLRQGKMRWFDGVDLHGSTIDEAREAVLTLINTALANDETVVKIMHGKGTDAVIKTCVNGWLRQIPDVLAFVSAPNNDGGNGAVLVLLKRKKLS